MRISKIEFENFRNFKNHGEINCSTDGKVTVIYGKNGVGKTTLHQLFQWIFYGTVHFNRTTSNVLYNWEKESETPYKETFSVLGRIDFEHQGTKYSLTRTNTYKKELDSSSLINEDLELQMLDSEDNWNRIDKPQETIEKLLPSGLSDYFFFDGENMIADLRLKGKDSAKSLRKALYSILDLDLIENALNHIGSTDLKTTVLGKLFLSKGSVGSGSEIGATKANIENAQNKLSELGEALKKDKEELAAKQQLINDISESIGSVKSKEDYEQERAALINSRDVFLGNVKKDIAGFGNEISSSFPQMLISKAVSDAKKKMHLRVQDSSLPIGLEKRLIAYLVADTNNTCICGRELTPEHKMHISAFLEMMPPYNFDSMYINFTNTAKIWGQGYNRDKLNVYIESAVSNQEEAHLCDEKIKALDSEVKKSKDVEQLIVDRGNAEERCKELSDSITQLSTQIDTYDRYLKKQMALFEKMTSQLKSNEIINRRIEVMNLVRDFFKNKLDEESIRYSALLQDNIQELLNEMLTSKRSVNVSSDFSVRVVDSYRDESKSEGQFAVVSFAYIGGILKLVTNEGEFEGKEYPLVLDGPFSKLDIDQRQNVIDCIPRFAPQIILFSKDGLQEYISPDLLGKVYTIHSNEEKNVSEVKEGYAW